MFAEITEEHLARVRHVFEHFYQSNLKLSPKKCKVRCVEHIVSEDGISTNPDKISKLQS